MNTNDAGDDEALRLIRRTAEQSNAVITIGFSAPMPEVGHPLYGTTHSAMMVNIGTNRALSHPVYGTSLIDVYHKLTAKAMMENLI